MAAGGAARVPGCNCQPIDHLMPPEGVDQTAAGSKAPPSQAHRVSPCLREARHPAVTVRPDPCPHAPLPRSWGEG